jgi:hypothetical protein
VVQRIRRHLYEDLGSAPRRNWKHGSAGEEAGGGDA